MSLGDINRKTLKQRHLDVRFLGDTHPSYLVWSKSTKMDQTGSEWSRVRFSTAHKSSLNLRFNLKDNLALFLYYVHFLIKKYGQNEIIHQTKDNVLI